ncbi:type VI secretion system Vgr family protein [Ideonella sp. A 288]|uniref:type VI secretion system Vgr family protein n=1 Tax=Ideonella sp. A 288 TaxID=1962181 RepID=UPI000B4B7434|nr:type VI secretion system tip protein TssI/VgrG [Ideonella sp. A 288]
MAITPPFSLTSPLPPAELRFASMSHTAGLSTLEEMRLQMISPESDITAEKLLGQSVNVAIELRDGVKRHINGYVTRFGFGRHQGRYSGYEATVRPWLWFLTRTADCRIFQEQTVQEIVETVFADHAAVAKFEFKLNRQYRKRVYCVQYRETDFNFVARLLEDEGIYWYFEHTDGDHRLILVDSIAAHTTVKGYDTLPYYANAGQVPPDTEYISGWNFSRSVETGKASMTSYDFERPSTKLYVEAMLQRQHDQADHEQFDFQGDYTQKADGQQLSDNRIDELQSRHEQLSGSTNAHGMTVGHLFTLEGHPRDDQNAEYLCTQTSIVAQANAEESGNAAGDFQCSFGAMPSSQTFRPMRRTPKPFVQGPQTAVVVGPSGEEIFTDKYSRVKVQFHWDRLGGNDEKSSCWVRVSSPWAGKSFGFIQIPRMGQEVVVDFLEGDPDQPLITGRVYNAEQMPPWELPANATQSGVLSRSSKGGSYSNANALRFEDKKGSEQVWLHAEKNQDIEVENDETHWVGHDRTKTIDHDETVHVKHDRTETVDNDETITIHHDRKERVDNNEKISIGVNRAEDVGANETIEIGANRSISVGASESATVALQRTHTVGVNETIAIGAAQEITVGAAQIVAVGAAQSITVGANQSTSVGANQSNSVGAQQTINVGGNRTLTIGGAQSATISKGRSASVGDDDSVKIGKNLVLDAGDSITIKTGSASITMKKDGTISVKGKDITISGSGKVNVKASSDIVMKGSKILQN